MLGSAIAYVGQLSWVSQLGLVLYSTPVALWGLGAVEGAARTAFNGVAWAFSHQHAEKTQVRWDQYKKDKGITLSCLAITAISTVPVAGTFFGYWEFNKQCRDYAKIKTALKVNTQKDFFLVLGRGFNELNNSKITEQSLNQLWNKLEKDSMNFMPKEKLNLPDSLIHNYYGYSVTYIALEKTTESIQFTAGKVKQLVLYLSQHNLIKKVGICALSAIKNEVSQTLEDTIKNKRESKAKQSL